MSTWQRCSNASINLYILLKKCTLLNMVNLVLKILFLLFENIGKENKKTNKNLVE